MHSLAGNFLVNFFLRRPACIFSHGRFLWAPSLGLFWYALSWDPFILHSFSAESSMSSFAGVFPLLFFAEVFCVTFFAGFPMHGLWHGFYHGLFLGDCFRELLLMDDFHGLFRGAFFAVVVSASAFAGLFCLAFFAMLFPRLFLWFLSKGHLPCTPLRSQFSCLLSQGFFCIHFRRDFK